MLGFEKQCPAFFIVFFFHRYIRILFFLCFSVCFFSLCPLFIFLLPFFPYIPSFFSSSFLYIIPPSLFLSSSFLSFFSLITFITFSSLALSPFFFFFHTFCTIPVFDRFNDVAVKRSKKNWICSHCDSFGR